MSPKFLNQYSKSDEVLESYLVLVMTSALIRARQSVIHVGKMRSGEGLQDYLTASAT